eukprot:TRINITY_DN4589_c0_g1_i1.p1 TRINITY_DN4589_c0_g1~~TRINITY_DN4589_c0_g1_i1.p1  ORF type:complete len:856 (+),score=256.02 TRINITY_DN4589_c0_g1_i1:69-2636(+)
MACAAPAGDGHALQWAVHLSGQLDCAARLLRAAWEADAPARGQRGPPGRQAVDLLRQVDAATGDASLHAAAQRLAMLEGGRVRAKLRSRTHLLLGLSALRERRYDVARPHLSRVASLLQRCGEKGAAGSAGTDTDEEVAVFGGLAMAIALLDSDGVAGGVAAARHARQCDARLAQWYHHPDREAAAAPLQLLCQLVGARGLRPVRPEQSGGMAREAAALCGADAALAGFAEAAALADPRSPQSAASCGDLQQHMVQLLFGALKAAPSWTPVCPPSQQPPQQQPPPQRRRSSAPSPYGVDTRERQSPGRERPLTSPRRSEAAAAHLRPKAATAAPAADTDLGHGAVDANSRAGHGLGSKSVSSSDLEWLSAAGGAGSALLRRLRAWERQREQDTAQEGQLRQLLDRAAAQGPRRGGYQDGRHRPDSAGADNRRGSTPQRTPSVLLWPQSGSTFDCCAAQLRKQGWDVSVCGRRQAGVAREGAEAILTKHDVILAEKGAAERLVEEWRRVAPRWAQQAGRGRGGERRRGLVINYFHGSRELTLKTRMARMLRGSQVDGVPLTFTLTPRSAGDERQAFQQAWHQERARHSGHNLWILKSSHGSKGDGIRITTDWRAAVYHVDRQSEPYSWVVQRYIERPFLIDGRKFDIRVWVLLDSQQHAYVYKEGVLRTSSAKYNAADLSDALAHLTNHAIQQRGPRYGAFEEGNEMWYADFERYLRRATQGRRSFARDVVPQIHRTTGRTLQAARQHLHTPPPPLRCFQLFGFDFMLDEDFRLWLIEVNGSPMIAEALRERMVADMLEIAVLPHCPHAGRPERSRDNGFEQVASPLGALLEAQAPSREPPGGPRRPSRHATPHLP